MRKLTTVNINPNSLKVIRKFAEIHNWTFNEFCERLAVLLNCGIDGLMETDIEELRKLFSYSDVLVSTDIRQVIGEPKNE